MDTATACLGREFLLSQVFFCFRGKGGHLLAGERYDGRSWSYTEPHPRSFFDRAFWNRWVWSRYGQQARTAQSTLLNVRGRRQTLLYAPLFTSLSAAVDDAGLRPHVEATAESWLAANGVGERYQREIFAPWVRGRSAQNLGTTTSLAAFTAADNTGRRVRIRDGGIAGLLERMLVASGATVQLGSRVVNMQKGVWGGWMLQSMTPWGEVVEEPFDAVIIATSAADVHHLTMHPGNVTYTGVHTAVFTSPGVLAGGAFSGKKGGLPRLVLTTPCSWEYKATAGRSGLEGLGHAPFWRLETVAETVVAGRREWVYRVMAPMEIGIEVLRKWVVGGEVAEVRRYYVSFPVAREVWGR